MERKLGRGARRNALDGVAEAAADLLRERKEHLVLDFKLAPCRSWRPPGRDRKLFS
jgi:hypothetical protein